MQDRFKFRFWNTADKKMQSWSGSLLDQAFNNDKLIPMQCTGLKDKNGKLIYEGDIIAINTHFTHIVPDDYPYRYPDEKGVAYYVVEWDEYKSRFFLNCKKYTKDKPPMEIDYIKSNHNVIGNIYEQPELLKEQE